MTTTSTLEPRLGQNWSTLGAVVVVSVLGPALILLLTIAPLFIVELASAYLGFSLCWYLGSCAPGGGEAWSDWLVNDVSSLYALWVTLGTGFACFVTLEAAFHIFRRATPITVLCWHALLVFLLAQYFPIDTLRSLISVGWGGTALVSMHYYLSYKALPLYQPPKTAAEGAQEASPLSRETSDSTKFPNGFDRRQWLSLVLSVLHGIALVGLVYYAFVNDMAMVFVIGLGLALYHGLFLLHQFLSSGGGQAVTIGGTGLIYQGQRLSWGEIGRVWRGPDGCGHVVMIETPAAAAKRMLRATNWVYRLFALCEVARRSADMVAHGVLIDTRFHLGGAAELVQLIEAHRPPGSRWIPAAECTGQTGG